MGREPKLTDAKVEAIAAKVMEGAPFDTACALAGVSHRAGVYWLAMARALTERVPGKPPETVTGEEPEAASPWPRLPAPLLVRFLRAIERARAVDEANRIARITDSARGGAVIYERTETAKNEKTGVVRTVTERRVQPPDWQADAWVLERRDPDRFGRKTRFPELVPAAAAPGKNGGSGTPNLLDVLQEAWALIQRAVDPRALPAPIVEGELVRSA